MVKLVNERVPKFDIDQPVPVNVMVPVGLNDTLLFTVSAPLTVNDALGWLEGVPDMVRLLNDRVPEFDIDQPVPVNVMVPEGANVMLLFKVSVPFISNEAVG